MESITELDLNLCNTKQFPFSLVPTLLPNLKELDLTKSEFTIVPDSFIECRFLWKLVLDGCKQLEKIEGIPPRLRNLSARKCESLCFSCRSMLLKQELHEAGTTDFELASLETESIPEWFELQSMDDSISVSFGYNLLLCIFCPLETDDSGIAEIFFNGKELISSFSVKGGHALLVSVMIDSKDERNHVKVMVETDIREHYSLYFGIHGLT